MWDFNLNVGLLLLSGLAFSLLNGLKQLGGKVLLSAGLLMVVVSACMGCGSFYWPRPANLPVAAIVCLAEDLADSQLAPPVWTMEPSLEGLKFTLGWELVCPRSKLTAVDQKW